MGKHVRVMYVAKSGETWCSCCTVGNTYHAIIPDVGEKDVDGMEVKYSDEVWIVGDDNRNIVIGQLSDGFEVL